MKFVCKVSPFKVLATHEDGVMVQNNSDTITLNSSVKPNWEPELDESGEWPIPTGVGPLTLSKNQPQQFLDDTGITYSAVTEQWELPLEGLKTTSIQAINAECTRLITAKWPLEKQQSCALGVYPVEEAQQCADDIAAMIAASNDASDAIEVATDINQVEAVQPVWPII